MLILWFDYYGLIIPTFIIALDIILSVKNNGGEKLYIFMIIYIPLTG